MIPRVLLDCDGPLARFTEAYLEAIYIETGERHDVSKVTQWSIHACTFFTETAERCGMTPAELKKRVDKHVARPGFCAEIKPQPEAKAAVLELHSIADVWVVTSPWDSSPTWMHERHHWLQREFGIARDQIIQTGKKYPIHGNVFVDDKASHVVAWACYWHMETAVLFDMHHNQREPGHASIIRGGWTEVLDLVRKMVSDNG